MTSSQYSSWANPPGYGSVSGRNDTGGPISSVLKRAAYFLLFSVPNPETRNVPILSTGDPSRLIGMKVFEQLHRFEIQERLSSGAGLRAVNLIGEPAANISIDWRVIPEDFVAAPDRLPPPTNLDPGCSQRFAMYNGRFQWNDSQQSGFHGFGAGRTFPFIVNGKPQLRIGAVVDILEGFGALEGLQGNVVVNGFIQPPYDLALSIAVRIVDPASLLQTDSVPRPLAPVPNPDPDTTYLVFLGQPDPERPIVLNMEGKDHVTGARVHELLRCVQIGFDVQGGCGVRSFTKEGPISASLQFDLDFDSAYPMAPTPFQTRNAVFTFHDQQRNCIGTLRANVAEGRGFATNLPQAPPPIVRVAGFGPFLGGTGQFSDVSGMLSLNGIISISSKTPSILYVLRIADPQKRFAEACYGNR